MHASPAPRARTPSIGGTASATRQRRKPRSGAVLSVVSSSQAAKRSAVLHTSFADAGRPQLASDAEAQVRATIAASDAANRQAVSAHNFLKEALKRRVRTPIATMEKQGAGLSRAMALISECQELYLNRTISSSHLGDEADEDRDQSEVSEGAPSGVLPADEDHDGDTVAGNEEPSVEPQSPDEHDEPVAAAEPTTHRPVHRQQQRRHLDLTPCGKLEAADLFLVLQAIRQSLPFVCSVDLRCLTVPASLAGPVGRQLRDFVVAQRVTQLDLDVQQCKLHHSDRSEIDTLVSNNASKQQQRQAQRIRRSQRRKAAAERRGSSARGSVSAWQDATGTTGGEDDTEGPVSVTAEEQALLVLQEHHGRVSIHRAYITQFASLVAQRNVVRQPPPSSGPVASGVADSEPLPPVAV